MRMCKQKIMITKSTKNVRYLYTYVTAIDYINMLAPIYVLFHKPDSGSNGYFDRDTLAHKTLTPTSQCYSELLYLSLLYALTPNNRSNLLLQHS